VRSDVSAWSRVFLSAGGLASAAYSGGGCNVPLEARCFMNGLLCGSVDMVYLVSVVVTLRDAVDFAES
jgi:hypothetical protein